MNGHNIWRVGIILLLGSQSCVEPFDLEIPGGSTFLVVDGRITDQPGPYQVELSYSSDFGIDHFSGLSGADVVIYELEGGSETLVEISPGKYQTNSIHGEVGKSYKLLIRTSGRQYESSWETLKPSAPIDSVYWSLASLPTTGANLEGIQLSLDSHDPANSSHFYRYEWTETWYYTVPFATGQKYLGNREIEAVQPKRGCWVSISSNSVSVASSTTQTADAISRQPLLFVSTETNRLQHRYSIEVRQFVINEPEYQFFKGLQETSQESGELFDRQPQSLTSNVTNLADPNEPVLGWFSVNGVSSERIFIDHDELPSDLSIKSYTDSCELQRIPFTVPFAEERVISALNSGSLFFDYYGAVAPMGFLLTSEECADCTRAGGSTEKPSFWQD